MNEPNIGVAAQSSVDAPSNLQPLRARRRGLGLTLLVLVLLFSVPLYHLARFALGSSLYSHILLIPITSFYLVWSKRQALPRHFAPAFKSALLLAISGLTVIAGYGWALASGVELAQEDALALTTLSFLLLCGAACSYFLGAKAVRSIAFPLGFLVFMVPIPTALMTSIETLLQYGSGAVAHVFFKLEGTPVFYQNLHFQLPGITLHVAPECSGIRSTLVLLIVSVVTGYFFLRSPLNRALLTLAIIPLALARNGLRIFTIGELCVHVGPEMIDSFIHKRGGPIFFAISLVPFFIFLLLLLKRERAMEKRTAEPQPIK